MQRPLDLAYVLRSPEVYLVPRGGGKIVVGATVERVGFDRRVDPLTIRRLQAQAAELWPPIASAPVVESWTGLRPGTSDGLPVIGSAGRPHCWVATGHFRNGILLAPATGLDCAPTARRAAHRRSGWRLSLPDARLSDKIQSAAL